MYVRMNVRTYVCAYERTYVCMYVCTYVRVHVHMDVHTYVRTYVHTYIRTYGRTYLRTYVSTYVRARAHLQLLAHCVGPRDEHQSARPLVQPVHLIRNSLPLMCNISYPYSKHPYPYPQ